MQPTPGLKNANKLYFLFSWLYPVWRRAFPKFVTTLAELGLAMINVVLKGYSKTVIEVEDIRFWQKCKKPIIRNLIVAATIILTL
jgi:hypothetical protein